MFIAANTRRLYSYRQQCVLNGISHQVRTWRVFPEPVTIVFILMYKCTLIYYPLLQLHYFMMLYPLMSNSKNNLILHSYPPK